MEMSAAVGAAVRAHRKERGWSLDRAATRLGVSRRLLTQIESGSANPSLSTLLSIANGFGIDLTYLIAQTPGAVDAVLQPDNGSAALLWSTDAGSAARLVVGMGPLEMWVWRLEPGESKRSDAHSAGSLEALIVNAGRVEVDIEGGETHTVDAGQSLIFAADVDHGYRSVADGVAEFHLAVFDPIDNPAGR